MVPLRQMMEKKKKAVRSPSDCLLLLSEKRLLVLVPHQFSLFSVLVFPDLLASLFDYAAHSAAPSRCKSYLFTFLSHPMSTKLSRFSTISAG